MAFHGPASLWELILLAVVLLVVYAFLAPRVQVAKRRRKRRALLARLGRDRGARVLTLVHGKAPMSFPGRPLYRMIDVDDAEAVIRGIRDAGDRPVDLILHTPGGQYHAALQIARALRHHKQRTRVLVPHVAMSGGTLIALAADEIVMDPDAMMGPVDPQVGDLLRGLHSATSWVKVTEQKGTDADDATLALGDLSRKLLDGTRHSVLGLVEGKVADPEPLVARLVEGGYAHAYPLGPDEMRTLGLPVTTDMPREVHAVLSTYQVPRPSNVEAV